MSTQEILSSKAGAFRGALEHFETEAAKIRTGRANPSIVEDLLVDYYGSKTPLKQMASITVPEARMLVIAPWDQGSLPAVADAIRSSDLGLNPADDGHVIRLSLPMLTEDRRKELAKVLNARAEEARVSIRTVREDAWKDIQELEKEGLIGEDEKFRGKDDLQKEVDGWNAKLESARKRKEEEILTI